MRPDTAGEPGPDTRGGQTDGGARRVRSGTGSRCKSRRGVHQDGVAVGGSSVGIFIVTRWRQRVVLLVAIIGLVLLAQLDGMPLLLQVASILTVSCMLVVVASRGLAKPRRTVEKQGYLRHVSWELERARRHNRPLVLARVVLSSRPDKVTARQWAEEVRSRLRATDVAWIERDGLTLLLPEGSRSQARFAIARVTAALRHRANPQPARIAVFPDDEITLAGLLDAIAHPRAQHLDFGQPSSVGEGVNSVP